MKQIAIFLVLLSALAGCSGDNNGVVFNGNSNVGNTGNTGNTGPTESNWSSSETVNNPNPDSGNGTSGTPQPTVTSFAVSHRNGQTFLTWGELGNSSYNIYRHNVPITNSNLGSATLLTRKWGPLDENTSINRNASSEVPRNFVIKDNSSPLRDDEGLFVYTPQNGQQGSAYYAITTVDGGQENRYIAAGRNASSRSVNERVSTPRPVLTKTKNGGKGRVYTQYMDYAKWNPTFNGYAFNFAVALPGNYNPSRSYPLMLELHAYNELHKFLNELEFSSWQAIQVFPVDPGDSIGASHTWWYGHSADHNYKTQGSVPRSGKIENFTEQRVLAAVNFLIDDGEFNVDRNLVHAYGHSMGASGALSLGMRYPSVFAGIYASQPMTNYSSSPTFQENFVRVFGEQSANLQIVNNGRNAEDIRRYNGTRVWDWMNHQEQLRRRSADRFAFLMVDHGKDDTTIDWQTQGKPMAKAFTDARVGFAAVTRSAGHSWMGFASVNTNLFGFGFGDDGPWRYPRNLSFPGIQNASGSGALQPNNFGEDRYNTSIDWSTPKNNFHQPIVDTSNKYEISIRSLSSNQTADITPRNTNSFKPSSGQQCSWTAINIANNANIGSGRATVDGSRLLTIPRVQIVNGSGTRLAISC